MAPRLVRLIADWTQTCGGEEVLEASGDDDYVGEAPPLFTPAQWRALDGRTQR